jgi:uncharacterized membrane protein YfcA
MFSEKTLWRDLVGVVSSVFIVALGTGGGLGGGGLLVPLFAILYDSRLAIPLSKAAIFGGTIGSFIVNIRERHPHADRPLIEFNAALMLEPSALLGTIFGVLANRVFPNWVITGLLVLLLAFTVYRTARKVSFPSSCEILFGFLCCCPTLCVLCRASICGARKTRTGPHHPLVRVTDARWWPEC